MVILVTLIQRVIFWWIFVSLVYWARQRYRLWTLTFFLSLVPQETTSMADAWGFGTQNFRGKWRIWLRSLSYVPFRCSGSYPFYLLVYSFSFVWESGRSSLILWICGVFLFAFNFSACLIGISGWKIATFCPICALVSIVNVVNTQF